MNPVTVLRKAFTREFGTLAKTFMAAMQIWDAQKAEGVSQEDRIDGLEKTLRAAWPKGRDVAWKFLCESCADYGLQIGTCPGDATCGRPKRHLAHEYGVPCWCPAGKKFTKREPSPDDFTQAGKTKAPKVRSFSQVGR